MFASKFISATAVMTGLRFALSLVTGLFKHAKADSLVSFTKPARVEPITLIDQRAVTLPYLHDALQALNSMFIGYYLQAVSLLVNVGNINVVKLLDSLNPDRDAKGAVNSLIVDKVNEKTPSFLSLEAYRYSLPVPAEHASLENAKLVVEDDLDSPSAAKILNRTAAMKNLEKNANDTVKNVKAGGGSVNLDVVKEAANLSVGKLVEVTVSAGKDQKATFPISVRLITTILSSPILTHILGDGSRDISMRERWHGWRSGQLEFIRDLILCQDLIDERRKALMKDDTGTYAEILRRRAGNSFAGVLSGNPSIGTASNLVVMTAQTARELETSIGGRLSDKHTRDKVFKNTYIMILMVIDPEWEQVTIYHRGIALPTKLSVKELKVANKGTGPDVAEILKAYQLGMNPTI